MEPIKAGNGRSIGNKTYLDCDGDCDGGGCGGVGGEYSIEAENAKVLVTNRTTTKSDH